MKASFIETLNIVWKSEPSGMHNHSLVRTGDAAWFFKVGVLQRLFRVKKQVDEIVEKFNLRVIKNSNNFYVTRYRGKYLYLSRSKYGSIDPICRLEYIGSIENWNFAIYKYSSGRYDPDEWMFPGAGNIDGTVEGAMKAGLEAYPTYLWKRKIMPREIIPSLYECDCGHQSHFFENTIREMKEMSHKKRVQLGDSADDDEHWIVFYKGEIADIICPKGESDAEKIWNSKSITPHNPVESLLNPVHNTRWRRLSINWTCAFLTSQG